MKNSKEIKAEDLIGFARQSFNNDIKSETINQAFEIIGGFLFLYPQKWLKGKPWILRSTFWKDLEFHYPFRLSYINNRTSFCMTQCEAYFLWQTFYNVKLSHSCTST